ncbi:hypothetical protein LPJ56_006072, partial [Coemansia sp. RSA 2599]
MEDADATDDLPCLPAADVVSFDSAWPSSPAAEAHVLTEKAVAATAHESCDDDEKDLVTQYVSLELAYRQASSRVAHELSIKDRQAAGIAEIRLSQASEQLVLDNLRSGHITVPLPEIDEPVDVVQWTKSANFVFETLKHYGFDDSDVKSAMMAMNGAGDVTDTLAWLCFYVAADKMPVDMRDKLEKGSYSMDAAKSDDQALGDVIQDECADAIPLAKVNDKDIADVRRCKGGSPLPKAAARIDQAAEHGKDKEDTALLAMLAKLGLDEYDSDEYDSDEGPGIVYARRSVRMRGLSEWLDLL